MTLSEIFSYSGGGLLLLLCFVQISPIKVNPLSWLAKQIGRAVNGEVLAKVDKLEKGLSGVQDSIAEEKAVTCRVRILRFGDECQHGMTHSKDYFDQTLQDIKTYERYCAKHPEFENNVTVLTSKYIKDLYRERLEKGDFL